MKSILFLLVAIVATLPSEAWDPFDPVLVNVPDVQTAQKFIAKIDPIREFYDPFEDPIPPFSCYNDNSCTVWGPWKKDTAIIAHPNFPDCPIYIGYRHRNCTNNQKLVQHDITGFSYLENDPDCASLKTWLLNGSGGTTPEVVDPERMNQLHHDIYALLAKELFIQFNSHLMGWGDTLYCDDYEHYKVSYVKGTCTGWCVGYYTCNATGTWMSIAKKRVCDADACCKVSNYFCIDRTSGTLIHREEVEDGGSQPSNCTDAPVTDNECYNDHGDSPTSTLEQVRVINCGAACSLNFLNLGGDQIVN